MKIPVLMTPVSKRKMNKNCPQLKNKRQEKIANSFAAIQSNDKIDAVV
jgi:hypothetical protein